MKFKSTCSRYAIVSIFMSNFIAFQIIIASTWDLTTFESSIAFHPGRYTFASSGITSLSGMSCFHGHLSGITSLSHMSCFHRKLCISCSCSMYLDRISYALGLATSRSHTYSFVRAYHQTQQSHICTWEIHWSICDRSQQHQHIWYMSMALLVHSCMVEVAQCLYGTVFHSDHI